MQPEDHLYANDEWWIHALHSYVGGKSKDEMGDRWYQQQTSMKQLEIDLNTKISICHLWPCILQHLSQISILPLSSSIPYGPNTSTIIRGSLAYRTVGHSPIEKVVFYPPVSDGENMAHRHVHCRKTPSFPCWKTTFGGKFPHFLPVKFPTLCLQKGWFSVVRLIFKRLGVVHFFWRGQCQGLVM